MPQSLIAEGDWKGRQVRFRRDRMIVSVRPGTPLDPAHSAILAVVGADLQVTPTSRRPAGRRWAIIEFPPHAQAETRIPALAQALAQRPDVEYAEPDFIVVGHLEPTSEPEYVNQTVWTKLIDLEGAWDITQGSGDVLLAVIDSGISITPGKTAPDHPELSGDRFIVRHVHDSVDVYHDYVGDDGVGTPDDEPRDENGHGTHVTGIIAAAGNNGTGIAGINWVSPVYVARVLGRDGQFPLGTAGNVKTAVEDLIGYAADEGYARVIVNLSLGTETEADSLRQMCKDAGAAGFLLCCAVGSLEVTGSAVDYPGAFAAEFDHVIAIGAMNGGYITDPSLDTYENISLFAPGWHILSTVPDYDCYWSSLYDPAKPYFETSGSSQACAIVSGVASLMWSANPKLTPAQIKDCLLHTADSFVDVEDEGKRIHAGNAVRSASWVVVLDTPHLTFVDVAEGETRAQTLSFQVASCTKLNFSVVPGSDSALPASLAITGSLAHYDPDVDGDALKGIEVTYTGSTAGDVAFGEFKVACAESGQEWTVHITANTVSTTRAAVVLVADRSGSMSELSGVDSLTRMDVLQYSAEILVDTLRVGDALAVVSFDDEAAPVAGITEITGEATISAERKSLKDAIALLAPGGSTSIGDGVVLGNTTVAAAPQPLKALLVLTDGHENTAEYIVDVMEEIAVSVYAIGMGTATVIQPESLSALTVSTGGNLVLTDTMDDSTRYKVAKYLVQMLAGISGESLVLDPGGYLRPGLSIEIPFQLCRDDRSFTAVLMTEVCPFARFELVTPGGERLAAGPAVAGVRFIQGRLVSHFRVSLPLRPRSNHEHAGTWRAVLSVGEEEFERYARGLRGEHRPPPGARGVAYEFLVLAESNVRMTSRATPHGHTPGSIVELRTMLSDRGLALGHANVHAHGRSPDGAVFTLPLRAPAAGLHEASFVAGQEGVYEFRVTARGHTARGDAFTREEMITVHIWQGLAANQERIRTREIERSHVVD